MRIGIVFRQGLLRRRLGEWRVRDLTLLET